MLHLWEGGPHQGHLPRGLGTPYGPAPRASEPAAAARRDKPLRVLLGRRLRNETLRRPAGHGRRRGSESVAKALQPTLSRTIRSSPTSAGSAPAATLMPSVPRLAGSTRRTLAADMLDDLAWLYGPASLRDHSPPPPPPPTHRPRLPHMVAAAVVYNEMMLSRYFLYNE